MLGAQVGDSLGKQQTVAITKGRSGLEMHKELTGNQDKGDHNEVIIKGVKKQPQAQKVKHDTLGEESSK